jgi:hypothetical protein
MGYIIGGAGEGLSALHSEDAKAAVAVAAEKLAGPYGFLNSVEVIKQLQF